MEKFKMFSAEKLSIVQRLSIALPLFRWELRIPEDDRSLMEITRIYKYNEAEKVTYYRRTDDIDATVQEIISKNKGYAERKGIM